MGASLCGLVTIEELSSLSNWRTVSCNALYAWMGFGCHTLLSLYHIHGLC